MSEDMDSFTRDSQIRQINLHHEAKPDDGDFFLMKSNSQHICTFLAAVARTSQAELQSTVTALAYT